MNARMKTSALGVFTATSLCASTVNAEIIGFQLAGTVQSASNFDSGSGIWSDVAQGQSWTLDFNLDTSSAFGFGTPGVDFTYTIFNTAYDFNIGNTSIQESMFAATVRVQGPTTGNESITIELNGGDHLGIPLTWSGLGVSTFNTEIPTGVWLNSIGSLDPIEFSSFTPGGANNDLAILVVENMTITPTPTSIAPLMVAGLVATRRRRS